MMPINPILAAAAANIAVGWLYYSEFAFGPMLKKITGSKCDVSKDFYLRMAVEIVASLMLATAFYIAILTFKKTTLPYSEELFTKIYAWFFNDANAVQADMASSLKAAGFLWFGFAVPMAISATAWHSMNWQKAVLKLGCKLAQFLAMAGALAYFG
jgi:hypothetical protein